MLQATDISLLFSDRKLFDDVNINFTPGNCYGLIGANGAGKSTFLKILAGDIQPTTGSISMGKDERLSVLRQNHFDFEEFTVLETVIMGNKRLYEVMKEKDAIYLKEDFSDEDGLRAAELEGEFAELDGWEAEPEAAQLLEGLNIPSNLHHSLMSELSAGQKVKVLLAQALFGKPDVLLLDEPTNGLDMQSIAWLEEFLINFENTVIVVSHDRYFLNKVCTHMADLDFGKIKLFVGNYDFWKESSELAARLLADQNSKAEEKIKQLQDFIARFSANASKSKQATSRKKMLDKITLEDIQPSSRRYPYVNFKAEREIGNDLLQVDNLSVSMDGKKVLDNISFTLRPGDKTAFIGPNDIATTALIRVLMGDLEADTGEIRWGVTTTRSYLPKDNTKDFDTDETILDWLRQFASKEEDDNTFLRSFLGRMLFSGDEVNKSVNVLSGGEKVRVMLTKMMLQKANVLVLDDPTNHLDLESITALNDGLKDFKGSMIFASHDHQFVQTLANRIIAISSKGMVERAETTFDEFLENKDVKKQMDALFEGEYGEEN